MNRQRCSTPLGTKDLLLEEASARREAERKLACLFESRGFSEVMTPGIEYLDVFLDGEPAGPVEHMYKLTDTNGQLLALRPDSTLPIARIASSRLASAVKPLRLYYAQDIYHMNLGLTGRADQEFQAGVELIGASGKRADLETVSLAASALQTVAGNSFRIEIGHVGFFRALMEELNPPEDIADDIRRHIEEKNYAALSTDVDSLPDCGAADALRQLPRLFGGEEIFTRAKELCANETGQKALTYLQSLYNALREMGLERHIMVDLGLLHRNEYYTGVIFRGYLEGSGGEALSGGRYDTLLRRFGADLPATGFAINMNAVTAWLHQAGNGFLPLPVQILVHAESGSEIRALRKTEELVHSGIRAEYSVLTTQNEAYAYAQKRGIAKMLVVSSSGAAEQEVKPL